jgi:hypothetical protein
MLSLLEKWVMRPDFDDCSPEAIDDNLRIQTENAFINGQWLTVRRVFVSARGAKSYERVGWVVNKDMPQCMVCSATFFRDKYHCAGCGNIVCDVCSPEEGVVFELSSAGPLRVCIQCCYGQDPIYAILHEDVVLAPFIVKRNNSYQQLGPSPSAIVPSRGFGASPGRGDHKRMLEFESSPVLPAPAPAEPEGHMVDPTPLLVLKTRLVDSERKVFINICGHAEVPSGRAIAAELAREGTESSGQRCLIFDVVCRLADGLAALDADDAPSEDLHKVGSSRS